jgi:phosphohistidine phosphatase SixA
MKRIAFLLPFAVTVLLAPSVFAAKTVILVRHAETADVPENAPEAKDPGLSPAGRERAESLARSLEDAGVTAIFSTDYKRTRETATPLARLVGLKTIQTYDPKNPAALAAKVREVSGTALIVGHSNTIPGMIKELGVDSEVTIAESEYDHLFIIDLTDPADPTFIRLRYR